MAPFRRGHSTPTTGEEADGGMPKRSESAWAARMRRKKANAKGSHKRIAKAKAKAKAKAQAKAKAKAQPGRLQTR